MESPKRLLLFIVTETGTSPYQLLTGTFLSVFDDSAIFLLPSNVTADFHQHLLHVASKLRLCQHVERTHWTYIQESARTSWRCVSFQWLYKLVGGVLATINWLYVPRKNMLKRHSLVTVLQTAFHFSKLGVKVVLDMCDHFWKWVDTRGGPTRSRALCINKHSED